MKKLHHSLAESNLRYGVSVWEGANITLNKSIETIMKILFKIIYTKSVLYPINILYQDARVLDIIELYCHNLFIPNLFCT